ncbi:hypothetical protein [Actinoplanes sp. L3-i22]|uniref:hypothetical protein n=1 Tax=Actinoplanes sp. L3-i22 TaxID=2836373 RepID=UPI002102ED8A|nr:hypothetical protein [Actinoplanes sp. L3-i22]
MTGPGMGFEVAGAARKRRRRWIGAVVAGWIVVLALLSWWSIRNDPATVPEQRDVRQAMPALRTAAGVLLDAATRAGVPSRNEGADGVPADGLPWAVRLGAIRTASCPLTPVREGVDVSRDVFLYVPQGLARAALGRVAGILPESYRAGVVAARVGTTLSLFADAGDFIAIDADAKADDQVLTLSASTGCRPGPADLGSDPAAGPAPATLTGTVRALGGPAGAAVSAQVVACAAGGSAATWEATAGASGDGPRGVPAGVTPVWAGAGGWAYRIGSESFVVADSGENLQVSVTTACGQ